MGMIKPIREVNNRKKTIKKTIIIITTTTTAATTIIITIITSTATYRQRHAYSDQARATEEMTALKTASIALRFNGFST